MPRHRFGSANALLLTKVRRGVASWLVTYKDHYVVVCGFSSKKQRFLIMDPAYGFASLGYEEFNAYWKEKTYAGLLCGQ